MKTIALFVLMAGAMPGQDTPAIDRILARVQTNTGQFEHSLPDFVCDEKVTSRLAGRDKLLQTTIESHFVGLQEKSGSMSFTERRDIVTFNGKPAARNQQFQGPFMFAGGFSSILDLTFGVETVPYHTYKLAGEEQLGGRDALVIEFATKKGQHDLRLLHGRKPVLDKDSGKAWISRETSQVLRLERSFLNVPKNSTPIVASVEYGEVRIGGKPFWMPATVRAEESYNVGSKKETKAEYLAIYTNYRKFDVSTGITFDAR